MLKKLSFLLALAMILTACAFAEEQPTVTGHVIDIEKYGHARLDTTVEEFLSAGFELGDIVTVTAGTYSGDMPFFNGYYVDSGEYMLRAYPGHENIAVCINYGKFAETAGIGVGDEVTITLKEKAGALTLQQVNNLVYTNDRADYASDEVFANFRPVRAGQIAEGRLYRSASPVNRQYSRAPYALALAEAAGVCAVLNLANSEEWLAARFTEEDFTGEYYKKLCEEGRVIAVEMPINYAADDFGEGIARMLARLSELDGPYLVHCTEGKDRAGFTCMLLEALMGASEEEIEADYMLSYTNYYGTEPGSEQYEMIAERNIRAMLRTVAGLEKDAPLADVDLQAAAVNYLLAHGMSDETVAALQEKLK